MTYYFTPHSPEWFAALEAFDQVQAMQTRAILKAAGRADVCSICGDNPAIDYNLVSPKPHPNAVATIRLCGDCLTIRKATGESFELLSA
jgi:hypothetical protein